jgi:3-hydroxymyristoyl/3-hydroxydecanoyl-(acyl carrier protein) dehydratase
MDGHFRAFSFVDRVTVLEPGCRIAGHYTIPAGLVAFPMALVGEAVGQLAAWAAMAALDFKCRPVAGLAAGVDFFSTVRPGQVLELMANLETLDEEAVAYGGTARVDGQPVMGLRDCVGPMLPIEQFDDPRTLRERWALLREAGTEPGGFGGVEPLKLTDIRREEGPCLHATLQVPAAAPFFSDHFPRRPVLPGSLLLNSSLELVLDLAATLAPAEAGSSWSIQEVCDVKLRAFTPPGGTLTLEVRLNELSGDAAFVQVEAREGKRLVGGARARLVSRPCL